MPDATNNPYNIKFLTIDNTFRLESGKVTDFTLKDVVKIHRQYYSKTTITELSKKHGLSLSTIKKIIVRFDCGDFDTFLKDYYPNELKNKDIEVFFINNRENLNDFLDYITIGYNIKSASQRLI